MGLPLNAFITIDLELGGITDCVSATGEFLRHAKRWLRGRGVETAHVWVQEPGEVVGQHVHLLLHLAPTVRREFFRRHRGWLKRCGAKSAAGLVDSSAVGKSYEAALGDTLSRNDYLINLRHVIDYVVKEASTETHLAFGLRTPAKGGIVIGKRSSSSENINRAARARRGREYGPGSPWHIALADLSQCTDPSREPTESEHSPSRSEARGLPHG
ncbi:MAG: hypothetical protein DI605_01210 [Sphingomonas sp.]|nr:MAG: hypothetical protein DI605_01210 [Sphingomonas sp.]